MSYLYAYTSYQTNFGKMQPAGLTGHEEQFVIVPATFCPECVCPSRDHFCLFTDALRSQTISRSALSASLPNIHLLLGCILLWPLPRLSRFRGHPIFPSTSKYCFSFNFVCTIYRSRCNHWFLMAHKEALETLTGFYNISENEGFKLVVITLYLIYISRN